MNSAHWLGKTIMQLVVWPVVIIFASALATHQSITALQHTWQHQHWGMIVTLPWLVIQVGSRGLMYLASALVVAVVVDLLIGSRYHRAVARRDEARRRIEAQASPQALSYWDNQDAARRHNQQLAAGKIIGAIVTGRPNRLRRISR